MNNTIELLFKSHEMREKFMAWLEDEGEQSFQDWVYNYTDDISNVFADFEEADQFVVTFEET